MARTPRTFSRRGRAETKARENIGQGKSREDVSEKATQQISGKDLRVSPTRSPSRFVGVLRLSRLHNARFHGGGMRDGRTWREGVLSLKHRRCNETNQYHPTQQAPHENDWLPGNENVHRRPPGRRAAPRLPILYCEKTQTFRGHLARAFSLKRCKREERNSRKDELHRTHRTVFVEWKGNVCVGRAA